MWLEYEWDGTPVRFVGCPIELGHPEVDPGADRCVASSERARCLHDAIPELTCRVIVADHRPIDYDLLLQDAGPFDERSGDAPSWAAAKGLNHSRVGESRRVSRTLQLEFWLIHAAGNVSGQHKEEIDAVGGAGGSPSCRCHQHGNHEGSQNAHYVDTVLLHCEQPGWLSFFLNHIKPTCRSYGCTWLASPFNPAKTI